MKHKLIVVGYLGIKRCYLDVAPIEALRRYRETFAVDPPDVMKFDVKEVEFDDEFGAYDVWPVS